MTVKGVDSPMLSVSPTEITFQVPWQTEPTTGLPEKNAQVKIESSSPFEPQLDFFNITKTASGRFLRDC